MDATQRRDILGRASALLDLRPEHLGFEGRWLEKAREAALRGDVPRLEALDFGWGSAVREAEIEDGIGRIAIRGPLLQGFWTDYSDIREAFDTFMDDAGARAILLDIDSPGGQVAGEMWDLAEAIRERRGEKPVVAMANDQATSAAYLIAAQAGEIMASSRSAVLGSIGVMATHWDYSGMLKQDGVTVTEVVTGRLKNALSRYRPLSRAGRELLSELVEAAFVDFIEHIEAGRGLSEQAIRDLEGGVLIGQAAVDAELADRIQSLDDVRARLIADSTRSPSGISAQTEEPEMASPKTTEKDPKPSGAPVEAAKPKTAAAEPATPATQPAAKVVDIESARREAREQGRKEAAEETQKRTAEIRQACDLAGCPERFGEFLDTDLTAEQVGQKILEERAANAGPEVDGHHRPGAGDVPKIDVRAIYDRWNRIGTHATG